MWDCPASGRFGRELAPLDTTIHRSSGPDAPPAQPWSGALEDDKPPVGSTVVKVSPDGGVTVGVVEDESEPAPSQGFDENLAERSELANNLPLLAQDIIDGVESDLQSRQGWMDNYATGLDLLGLKIEESSRTKAQKRNVSKSRDTTMLESVVKAQSMARGEILPAGGPAKIMTVPGITPEEEQAAADFETDFNQALTVGMPEYVPDLDRGLFGFFYSGNMFRYGYKCPFKGRPVVATTSTEDLIVSEEATNLETATRVTLRVPAMAPGEVRRRQFRKVWRECNLSGVLPETDPVKQKKDEIAGMQWQSLRPKDQPYCIYDTITDLDLEMFGYVDPEAEAGYPAPYKVTVEKYSKEILRIERYWKQGDKNFTRKSRIIHYEMVPGFGFLAYGFLHLQGNQTQALTAVVRLLLDALMFGNFPGGVKAKGVRTETNEINPGPGEWIEAGIPAQIDDIRKALMPLPYKDISAVAVQFYELVQQAAARVGAAAMLETGEGRTNVPVGTVMAMLEEKSVVMSAVHKRLHEALGRELRMLREMFAEDPDTLTRVLPSPSRQWAEATEFKDMNLVPASDPNVPSQIHRLMLATALATLMSMPVLAGHIDIQEGLKRVLRIIGITSPEALITQPPAQGDPNAGAAAAANASLQAKKLQVQQDEQDSQRKAATQVAQAAQKERDSLRQQQTQREQEASAERIAGIKEQTERMRLDAENARADREHALDVHQTGIDQQNAALDRHMQHQQNQQAQQNADQDRQERAQDRQFGGSGL